MLGDHDHQRHHRSRAGGADGSGGSAPRPQHASPSQDPSSADSRSTSSMQHEPDAAGGFASTPIVRRSSASARWRTRSTVRRPRGCPGSGSGHAGLRQPWGCWRAWRARPAPTEPRTNHDAPRRIKPPRDPPSSPGRSVNEAETTAVAGRGRSTRRTQSAPSTPSSATTMTSDEPADVQPVTGARRSSARRS